jgi:hypothetical protein
MSGPDRTPGKGGNAADITAARPAHLTDVQAQAEIAQFPWLRELHPFFSIPMAGYCTGMSLKYLAKPNHLADLSTDNGSTAFLFWSEIDGFIVTNQRTGLIRGAINKAGELVKGIGGADSNISELSNALDMNSEALRKGLSEEEHAILVRLFYR